MRLSVVQRGLLSFVVLTCVLMLYSVQLSLLIMETNNEQWQQLPRPRQPNAAGNLRWISKRQYQSSFVMPGSISCDSVRDNAKRGIWMDPNRGRHFVRRILSSPHHYVSLHNLEYDRVRYDSIFVKGEYYEHKVIARFENILQEDGRGKIESAPLPIVLDVGANIGYYSLLSAAHQHAVMSFEINPSNLIRICESIHWNQQYYGEDFGSIQLFRNGVSAQHNVPVQVVVPKRNPGEAKVLPMTEKSQAHWNNTTVNMKGDVSSRTSAEQQVELHATQYHSFATTVTLDALAQEHGWFENDAQIAIAILKMDTEGHEPQILQGATKLLQSNLVQNVLMEYRTTCHDAVFEILLEAGYVLVYDEPSTSRPRTMLSKAQSKTVIDRLHQTWAKSNETDKKYEDLWFRLETHQLPLLSSTKRNGTIRRMPQMAPEYNTHL